MTTRFFSVILLFMTIRQARREDAPRIMEIYHACTKRLLQQGIDQWSDEYPSREILLQDIRENHTFIAADDKSGEILGVVVLEEAQELEDHQHVKWRGSNDSALFLSRLAVNPDSQNSGIGSLLIEFAEYHAIAYGFGSIRLDADKKQELLYHMYKNRGFHIQGSVWYDDPPKEFFAMEKKLPNISIQWAHEKDLSKIFEIRETVFIEGQQVKKELEQDGLDDQAKHVIACEDQKPVGCARIRWVSLEIEGTKPVSNHYWKVERLAVVEEARKKGYGRLIMEWIEAQAKDQQVAGLTLHAQKYLQEFYQSLGYVTAGKPFMEAAIPHVDMVKELNTIKKRKKNG